MSKTIKFLTVILFIVQFATAQTIWNGTTNTSWYNSSQTEFTLTTAEELAGLAELVNNGNNFYNKTVKLGSDIMLNDTTNWKNWESAAPKNEWTPIGIDYKNNEFNGKFDGNGKIITGVYINYTTGYEGNYLPKGLFGYISYVEYFLDGGVINNLGVVASYIKGYGSVGGIVGSNCGLINNSYFIGNVEGFREVGGLAGFGGPVSNSYSMGNVSGELYVGGIIGEFEGDYNTINSYFIGIVSCEECINGIGGLVGGIIGPIVINSYYNIETNGQNDNDGRGEPKTTAELKQISTYIDWDFTDIWGINREINDGYPYLRIFEDGNLQNPISNYVSKKHSSVSFAGISNGQINLHLQTGNYTVELYSLQGRMLRKVNINAINGVNATGLKTAYLSKGMVILNVKQKGVSVLREKISVR